MGAAADAFGEFVDSAARLGITVSDYLVAGLPADLVERTLLDAGVVPHESLIDWFSSCNGVRRDWSGPVLFNGRALMPLDAAVEDWTEGIQAGAIEDDEDDEPAIYQEDWFPIVSDRPPVVVDTGSGEILAVDLMSGTRVIAQSLTDWLLAEAASIPVPTEWSKGMLHWIFEPGATDLSGTDRSLIRNVGEVFTRRPPQRVRLTHAEVGSISGNRGLELDQAQLVADHLIATGAPTGEAIEFVVEPTSSSSDRHFVKLFTKRS